MARALQVLSLFPRCGVLSVATSASTHSRRFASRDASRAWMGRSHVQRERTSVRAPGGSGDTSAEEPELQDLEDVEDKLQALVDEGRRRQRTVKYNILRRQMSSPGPPQRKLTWDAIEQIRYLKQELPEEWTVQRLAEGFSVTPDVILRVLRSTFIPSPERKAKQDANVMNALSQQVLPSGAWKAQEMPKLPRNHKPVTLLSENREDALVPVSDQNLVIQKKGSGSLANSRALVTVQPTQFASGISIEAPVKPSIKGDITSDTNLEENDEECWDGQVLTEKELEELMEMEKPSPVLQVGKEFFDADGNFLYRI
ncbi:neugrin [Betta splendens]|uniref:Neugrin n=1 Tax=Betta splendens TaxID=158456 RepID=A0A6P7N4P3_BETSP|nr:neugrin [Betta splendens]